MLLDEDINFQREDTDEDNSDDDDDYISMTGRNRETWEDQKILK